MINAKLDKILKLITPVIAVSKEMKVKHDEETVNAEPEVADVKKKKSKKAAKKVTEDAEEL